MEIRYRPDDKIKVIITKLVGRFRIIEDETHTPLINKVSGSMPDSGELVEVIPKAKNLTLKHTIYVEKEDGPDVFGISFKIVSESEDGELTDSVEEHYSQRHLSYYIENGESEEGDRTSEHLYFVLMEEK